LPYGHATLEDFEQVKDARPGDRERLAIALDGGYCPVCAKTVVEAGYGSGS
jgi:hypothetical protein